MNDLTINIEQPSDGFKISSKLINDMQESRSRSPRQRQVSAAQLDDQQANAKSITIVYLNAETTLQELQQEKSVSSAEQPAATCIAEQCTSIRERSYAASCAKAGMSRFPNARLALIGNTNNAEQLVPITGISGEHQPTDQGLQSLLVALDLDEA